MNDEPVDPTHAEVVTEIKTEKLRPSTVEEVFRRDHFTCLYCGFDGRSFDGWMQLSLEHILPRSSGGGHEIDNLAVACRSCNCITNRMKFDKDARREEIIKAKRAKILSSRKDSYDRWNEIVSPYYFERHPQ
jgi:5-methylcytosine-specific restriction endonuclease McrA